MDDNGVTYSFLLGGFFAFFAFLLGFGLALR